MVQPKLGVSRERIADFCRRHRIRKLAFFGSVLRDDFGPTSDVDVLVEFEPGQTPGWDIAGMQEELSAILGREVDFLTVKSLSRWMRDRVLAEAQVQYDRDRGGLLDPPADDGVSRRRLSVTERDLVYFGHMLDSAREAMRLVHNVDRAHYNGDRVLQLALARLVQIVGEAARRVSAEGRAAHPEIPWQGITAMRNVLVHDYPDVDEGAVWDVVTQRLPELVEQLEAFVPPGPPP